MQHSQRPPRHAPRQEKLRTNGRATHRAPTSGSHLLGASQHPTSDRRHPPGHHEWHLCETTRRVFCSSCPIPAPCAFRSSGPKHFVSRSWRGLARKSRPFPVSSAEVRLTRGLQDRESRPERNAFRRPDGADAAAFSSALLLPARSCQKTRVRAHRVEEFASRILRDFC